MSQAADAEMGADEAADLLAGIPDVEKKLTARTAGLTWIVWGIAIPGLFATYAAAEPLLATDGGFGWILSVLWIPWIGAGSLATNLLWATNAVTLDREPEGRGWARAGAYLALFFLLAAAVWGLLAVLDVNLAADAVWIVASGLLTVAIGFAAGPRGAPGSRVAVAGGLAIVAGGLALGYTAPSPAPLVNLVGAGLVGVVYHAVGGWLYQRG